MIESSLPSISLADVGRCQREACFFKYLRNYFVLFNGVLLSRNACTTGQILCTFNFFLRLISLLENKNYPAFYQPPPPPLFAVVKQHLLRSKGLKI